MITIQIIAVGVFREIMQVGKTTMQFEKKLYPNLTINTVVDVLDRKYAGRFKKELFLQDGSRNEWTRIILNGRDIRFLPREKLTVNDGDIILFSSVLAGG